MERGRDRIAAEIYRGPVPPIVRDAVRRLAYFRLEFLWALDINALLENLRRPLPRVGIYVNPHHVDLVAESFQAINVEEEGGFVAGIPPTGDSVRLYDEYNIIDIGPGPEETVREFDLALRSVLAAYPRENHVPALATAGLIIAQNLAPAFWRHRPHFPVPVVIVHCKTGLGKSKLIELVIVPAILTIEGLKRLEEVRRQLPSDELASYILPIVLWDVAVKTPEQG